jgi:hypothetical protein
VFNSLIHNELQVALLGQKVDLSYDYEVRRCNVNDIGG